MTPSFASLLQNFFADRLVKQCRVSPNTVASYRDTFRLLLGFADETVGVAPQTLDFDVLDAVFIGRFLDYLEKKRGNSSRTRNARLAAIRSFFRYVAIQEPTHALVCQRVLSMARKKQDRKPIAFLDRREAQALLAAPDKTTWTGRRDRALLLLAIQTGLRVSELVNLRCSDVALRQGAHVRCEGKGRKQRSTPLRKDAILVLNAWLRERHCADVEPLFPSNRGTPLSRDAVEHLVARHARTAAQRCVSLKNKRVTPHVLRHTAAMELLRHGVDRSVIALWLGHESVETTQMYLQADMRMKQRALARTRPADVKPGRYRPTDNLLAFLEAL